MKRLLMTAAVLFAATAASAAITEPVKTDSGLQYIDSTEGEGEPPVDG